MVVVHVRLPLANAANHAAEKLTNWPGVEPFGGRRSLRDTEVSLTMGAWQ